MDRTEHLAWAQTRALEYLDQGDITNALASLTSDLRKHDAFDNPAVKTLLAMEGIRCVQTNDTAGMRRLIEGFR